jgi:hypothetical protein
MPEVPDLKLVSDIKPQDNASVASTLRRLADDIESGTLGEAHTLVLAFQSTTQFRIASAGPHSDHWRSTAVFQMATARMVNRLLGEA